MKVTVLVKGGVRFMNSHLLVAFLCVVMLADRAEAYLDPGAGSVLTQLVLGGTAGLIVVFKLYWHRIRDLFGRKKSEEAIDPISRPE